MYLITTQWAVNIPTVSRAYKVKFHSINSGILNQLLHEGFGEIGATCRVSLEIIRDGSPNFKLVYQTRASISGDRIFPLFWDHNLSQPATFIFSIYE